MHGPTSLLYLQATPWEVPIAFWSLLALRISSPSVLKTHFHIFKSVVQFKTSIYIPQSTFK